MAPPKKGVRGNSAHLMLLPGTEAVLLYPHLGLLAGHPRLDQPLLCSANLRLQGSPLAVPILLLLVELLLNSH